MPQGSLWGRSTPCCTCDLPPPFLGWLLSCALQSLLAGCQPCPTACSPLWVTSTTEQLWMRGAAPQRSPRTHTGRCNSHMWDNPAWSQVTAIPRLSVLVFASTTFLLRGVLPRESKRPAAAAPQLCFCRGRSALQGKGASGQGEEGGKGKGHKGQGVGMVLETAADPTGR